MARKKISLLSFIDGLESYAEEILMEGQKVNIAKKSYLEKHKEEIINAVKIGYGYGVIAQYATSELLKTDIPSSFTYKNKEGEEITAEPIIYPADIINLYEENKNC